MNIGQRALYSLLRENWIRDPSICVEKWQVADYRALSIKELFEELNTLNIHIDSQSFLLYAEKCDTPEDLTDCIVSENADISSYDHVYLLLFELWRILVSEKLSLSIFCDEFDNQIAIYDSEDPSNAKQIHDIIATLQNILDENTDEGEKPTTVLSPITKNCVNDIESFLYDFIAEQIDNEDYSYATELVEGFYSYISDTTWFDFLRARLIALSNIDAAHEAIKTILKAKKKSQNLELYLEIASFMVQHGDRKMFTGMIKKSLAITTTEEEFIELLEICSDYCDYSDLEEQKQEINTLITSRENIQQETSFTQNDNNITTLLNILERSSNVLNLIQQ